MHSNMNYSLFLYVTQSKPMSVITGTSINITEGPCTLSGRINATNSYVSCAALRANGLCQVNTFTVGAATNPTYKDGFINCKTLDVSTEITAGSIDTPGAIAAGTVSASGALTADTVVAAGEISAYTVVAAGEISAGTVVAAGEISAVTVVAAGEISADTVVAAGEISADTVVAAGEISADSVTAVGEIAAATVVATGEISADTVVATGDISADSVTVAGAITASSMLINGVAPAFSTAVNFQCNQAPNMLMLSNGFGCDGDNGTDYKNATKLVCGDVWSYGGNFANGVMLGSCAPLSVYVGFRPVWSIVTAGNPIFTPINVTPFFDGSGYVTGATCTFASTGNFNNGGTGSGAFTVYFYGSPTP
jgi:hypothetical protein